MDATTRMVEALAEAGQITKDEATQVLALYQSPEMRAVRFDGVNGSIILTHGGFMDRATIRRALAMTTEAR